MKDLLQVEGLGRRDKVVFDYIFNYYYSSLCAFTMQYLKDRNAVEDLVQDFFVTIWVDARSLQIHSSLKSYLFAAVKNRCLDHQKHQKVTEKHRTYLLFSTENDNNSTDNYFAESELRQVVQNSLQKLPPRCREIFELSRHSGLSNQEISEQLGPSKRTVELQIRKSLNVLRKELVEYLPLLLIISLIG